MSKRAQTPDHEPLLPKSNALLRAAVSGLLGLTGAACEEEATDEEADPDHHDEHSDMCEPGDGDGDADAQGDGGHHSGNGDDAGQGDAGVAFEDKEISVKDVQHTYAELKAMCDARDGYVQTHASCSGTNTCQGFTYGDWGEDAQLIEHTCSGTNGCVGLSCVVPQEEQAGGGMTGEEIMKLDEDWYLEAGGNYGPKPCKNCHVPSEFDEDLDDYVYDYTKLRMLFEPGSLRNKDNWTDRSVAHQEAQVAFGVQGIDEHGTHYSRMAAYNKVFSKAEIERVVEHMRGFDPDDIVEEEINLEPGTVE